MPRIKPLPVAVAVLLALCGIGCLVWCVMNYGAMDWLLNDYAHDLAYTLVADQQHHAMGVAGAGLLCLVAAVVIFLRGRRTSTPQV
jgi:hypothetical protein